jgi:hypothetical protein
MATITLTLTVEVEDDELPTKPERNAYALAVMEYPTTFANDSEMRDATIQFSDEARIYTYDDVLEALDEEEGYTDE